MYKDAIYHLLIGISHKTENEASFTNNLSSALIGDRRFLDALAAALRYFDMEANTINAHACLGHAYNCLEMHDLA